ncbi:MAG TPA: type VI secretion system baseplate subunit TssE [Pseudomonadota bacterium]|nr:type VI secretion system baseplate subunit TssE [Pseudomonadota bacterium]HNK46958.1 type VI secretion system baseplate subunit TssE [Pseudomonadota bacterium]HNN54085.1 type VI secretion system baseplate subunit TssE [Pseudomonadota bacterium]HNO68440.1 type VI secretion system baseplate subunit TssE [Pseudomonadota bacterium]
MPPKATSCRSLFGRLRGPSPSDASLSPSDALRESILRNLERILNSRAGMSLACETYGIPDLTQIVSGVPERARDIERAIEKCIREFEPRLTTVEVEHFPDSKGPMTACFKIRASVSQGKSAEELWFETVVVSSGRVKLI